MTGRKRAPKRGRKAIKIVAIISCSLLAWIGLFFGVVFIETHTLQYVDDLRGYELSPIQGNVESVSNDEYLSTIAADKEGNNLVYWQMFPADVPNGETKMFYYAETVKPRRTYSDRLEIYVCCHWSEQEYSVESHRLGSFDGYGGGPMRRDDLFPLPSFVYRYQNGKFLYALLDKPNRLIHYIYLCEVGSITNIVFDHSLAPHKPLFS